jgi:AAHS family benzoate transporter-like MFS transporter
LQSPDTLFSDKPSHVNVKDTIDNATFNTYFLWVFFILHISLIISGYIIGVYNITLTEIKIYFDIDDAQAGFLASSALLGMMIGAFFLGMLSDTIGRKTVLIIAVMTFSAFNGILFFVQNYYFFAFCRFMAGIGVGSLTPICVSLLSEYSPKSKRTLLITIIMTGMPLGQLLASGMGLVFLQSSDWRLLYLLSFGGWILIPLIAIHLPESISLYIKQQKYQNVFKILQRLTSVDPQIAYKYSADDSGTEKLSFLSLFHLQYLRNTIALSLVFFSNMYLFYGVSTWLPSLMYFQGYAMNLSIIFLSVFLCGNIVTAPIIGLFTDFVGYKKTMSLFYIVSIIVIVILSFSMKGYAKYLLVFLIGGCIGVVQNTVLAIIPKFYTLSKMGTAIGMFSACSRFASFLAPALVGVMLVSDVKINLVFLCFAIPPVIGGVSILLTKTK